MFPHTPKAFAIVPILCAAALLCTQSRAHDVLWYEEVEEAIENAPFPIPFLPLDPTVPMEFGFELFNSSVGSIFVSPSIGEPCIVEVTLQPVSSDYIIAEVPFPAIGNEVEIVVQVIKQPPPGPPVKESIKGEWHATGAPPNKGCDAVTPNDFTVPVWIYPPTKVFDVKLDSDSHNLELASATPVILQAATDPSGPFENVGQGKSFTVVPQEQSMFFRAAKELGEAATGTLTDRMGDPQSGLKLSFPFGGAGTMSATDGGFTLPRLPKGNNSIAVTKPLSFPDPVSGATRTESFGIEVTIPSTNSIVTVQIRIEVQVFVIPACNCTPWCAIGYATINGSQTAVYFAGGANPPKNGAANCGQAQVTVTPPNGAAFPIKSGSGRRQNSGPNPASGTWKVTTAVCGQEKSCDVTVP
jgi:hypothetical protein